MMPGSAESMGLMGPIGPISPMPDAHEFLSCRGRRPYRNGEHRERNMAIRLDCPCGKKLRVGDELAGERTRCPACNQILAVPLVLDREPYAIADETREERKSRIISQPREETDQDADIQEFEADEGSTSSKKSASWVPAYCYHCDVSAECKRCVFYSGKQASVETEHAGNYVIVRTNYRNIQRHQIFLCQACALEGWKSYFTVKILMAAGGQALVLLAAVFLLVVPTTGSASAMHILVGLVLLCSGFPIYYFVISLGKLLNPTYSRSVMGKIAIRLARREVARHTGADSFFTSGKMKRMRRG